MLFLSRSAMPDMQLLGVCQAEKIANSSVFALIVSTPSRDFNWTAAYNNESRWDELMRGAELVDACYPRALPRASRFAPPNLASQSTQQIDSLNTQPQKEMRSIHIITVVFISKFLEVEDSLISHENH
jgi:hypothetical protein